jgi:hypothetical protein
LYSILGAIVIVTGLYTVVWGKSKDRRESTIEIGKGEGQDQLPIKNGTKSESNILDGIEINVQAEKLIKGAAKNVPTQG